MAATDLFDRTIGYDEEPSVQLAEGLSNWEEEQAVILYKLFNELWGVCIILGVPGTGKDLWANIISHKLKTYFPWKRILRDEKPRLLYGDYAGIFNDKVLKEDLLRMKAIATQVGDNGKQQRQEVQDTKLESIADAWVSSEGEVLLKNSVLCLTEYWRYCYNRDPHSAMNKTMGAIHKMKRHLDTLILGTVQLATDLDTRTCLPFIDWQVICNYSTVNPTGFFYHISKVKYDMRMGRLMTIGQPFTMAFDAGKPRANLGDGKIRIANRDYQPKGKVEKQVLSALLAGVNTYKELVSSLKSEEDEILWALKDMKFNKAKRAIDYPCFFGLYNSKSVPQIKTSLKVEE